MMLYISEYCMYIYAFFKDFDTCVIIVCTFLPQWLYISDTCVIHFCYNFGILLLHCWYIFGTFLPGSSSLPRRRRPSRWPTSTSSQAPRTPRSQRPPSRRTTSPWSSPTPWTRPPKTNKNKRNPDLGPILFFTLLFIKMLLMDWV